MKKNNTNKNKEKKKKKNNNNSNTINGKNKRQLCNHGLQWQVACNFRRITAAETDAGRCVARAAVQCGMPPMRPIATRSNGRTGWVYSDVKLCLVMFPVMLGNVSRYGMYTSRMRSMCKQSVILNN
jgi:hypothetical protein